MVSSPSQDLFGPRSGEAKAPYAAIVFDRPLDVPYTYAVPVELADEIAIGKRVEAPFGRGDKLTIGYCVGLSAEPPARQVKSIRQVLDRDVLLTSKLLELTRWMADYYLCGWGQVLQAVLPAGVRDNAGVRKAVIVEAIPCDELPKLTLKQQATYELLRSRTSPVELRDLCRQAKVGPGVIDNLVQRGLVQKSQMEIERLADEQLEPAVKPSPAIAWNQDQNRAWEPLAEGLKEGGFRPYLLHGVTGSGKTELYLRAIEEVVRAGKEAIVLVPEISLTPQTIERFRGRCGSVAVLHSHLGDAERGAHWRRVAAGKVQVVVGARSAVFAPCQKLGLIVIDEEHESSFKQESTPRYHGRDVAVMRARMEGIPILMGSATPSLESWHNAQRGAYTLLSMPNRVSELPMPPVRLVDQRHEAPSRGPLNAIGNTLEKAMHEALGSKGQVILLLNRRGFSTYIHCTACGHVVSCEHCDLALTFHKGRNALLCHYCGYQSDPVAHCPACKAATVRYLGLGTEKLASELAMKFPGKVIERMDSDTMDRPGSHARVLDAFRDGKVDILVGTQMIAKGLDFPNVTLVGVVNADVGLNLPDFRAAERTFQLLSQVAGRAGRGSRGGSVIIQTYSPEHPGIALAAGHDYLRFVEQELAERRAFQYPPYQRLARVIVRSQNADAAGAFADRLAGAFRVEQERGQSSVRLLGPAECPIFKLNGYFRYHFQLQSANSKELHQVLRRALASVRPPSGVEFQTDIDPVSMA